MTSINNEKALARCERDRENARTKSTDIYESEYFLDDLPPEWYDPRNEKELV